MEWSRILNFSLYFLMIALTAGVDDFESMCNNICLETWTAQYMFMSGENSGCMCGASLGGSSYNAGSCRISQITGKVKVKINIEYCMTYDEESNTTYMGRCLYNNLPFHWNGTGVDLPQNASLLNNFMCNMSSFARHSQFRVCGQQRRHGMLCGMCENGLGPAVMSYTHPCVECQWYGWLLYLALSFIPATILCFLITLLRINVLLPPLNALVLVCQVITSIVNLTPCSFLYYANIHQVSRFVLPVLTLYGFFNMDFFVYIIPPFCITNKMSIFAIIAMDYVVALYPLILAAMIYILIEVRDRGYWLFNNMWRPFHKCLAHFRKSWDIKGSIINAFATLYVLSFTKVVSTSVGLMLTTDVQNMCGTFYRRTHMYYNASCSLFEACHRPYAYLMLTVSTIVILLPSLYIFLHPCKLLHKCKFLSLRMMLLPHEIAKIFHQSFKDGTQEGTLDCRWFAGIYLLIRVMIAASMSFESSQHAQIVISIIGVLLVAIFRPHTHAVFNCLDSILFGGLALIFLLWPAGHNHHIPQVLIFFIPLLVILIFVGWKLIRKCTIVGGKKKAHLLRCCCFQGIRFRELSTQEQKPLLKKENSPAVSCTVVDID